MLLAALVASSVVEATALGVAEAQVQDGDGKQGPEAPTPIDAYRLHMDNGVKLFADRNYAAAIVEFQAAYKERPRASPLTNVALCYKAQFKYARAIATLKEALDKHGDTMDPADKQAAQDAVGEMERLLGFVTVRVTPPEAVVLVDGEQQPSEGGRLALGPGIHHVSARLDGWTPPPDKEIAIASGEQRELEIVLTKSAAPSAAERREPTRYSTPMMVTGLVVGSVGVLAAGGGVLIWGSADKQGQDSCEGQDPTNCQTKDDLKRGGIALAIAGAVGIAIGLPLFVVGSGPPDKPKAPPKKAALYVGPGSITARVAF